MTQRFVRAGRRNASARLAALAMLVAAGPVLAADPPRRAARPPSPATAAALEKVRINPDLDICEVTGDFDIGGAPPRRAGALVFNPRTDLVYTALDAAGDPELASRVVEGPARERAIRACTEFATRNRNTAAAQAYQQSLRRAETVMKAERARAAGQSVPVDDAAPVPTQRTAMLPPGGEPVGPSARAARSAAAATPGPAGASQAPEMLIPGVILPGAPPLPAEDAIGERLRQGIADALLRSPDVDAARREIVAANHLYQAAIRDRLNPEIMLEVDGGMSQGRRGPALQTGDDLDPATGQRTQTTNAGVRSIMASSCGSPG
ncbi:MAG: hypothetical protein IT562_17580 [Alphaproteobacteria bacterium]|nr:hypothetical protein [Alphaproteobacteria bacterium]